MRYRVEILVKLGGSKKNISNAGIWVWYLPLREGFQIKWYKKLQVLGITEKEFFDEMGVHFVGFVSQYGYDRVLSVLGRHVRDFLNGLDNLHEYLKFSYPRMRAPSFICENETRQGKDLLSIFSVSMFLNFILREYKNYSIPTLPTFYCAVQLSQKIRYWVENLGN